MFSLLFLLRTLGANFPGDGARSYLQPRSEATIILPSSSLLQLLLRYNTSIFFFCTSRFIDGRANHSKRPKGAGTPESPSARHANLRPRRRFFVGRTSRALRSLFGAVQDGPFFVVPGRGSAEYREA